MIPIKRRYFCKKCHKEFTISYKKLADVKNKITCLDCFELSDIVLEAPMIQFKGEGFTRKNIK